MYILSVNMWFQNLIRTFFFAIDNVIFSFIPTIYNLLIDIARTSVLSQSDIAAIATRVYELLAIFMVFKVIFSLIMYVVNPDDFSDKSKGVSKLGTNIVISLALLILVPYIFSYAFQLQTIILEDNSLGTLVFGDMDSEEKSTFSSAGDKIAYMSMAPFLVPNTSISELQECVTLTKDGVFNEDCSGLDLDADEIYLEGSENSLAGIAKNTEDNKTKLTITDVANYVYGVENESFALMHRQEVVLATAKLAESGSSSSETSEQFIFDYRYIFSTAVGVIIIVLLISFCMDVAVRSIKLSFLQLIAPIPILSYIDPKSGKDGMFKKWYQLCFKTYASLFVRLLALYFGIFIISRIDKISDIVNGSYQSSIFVKIFVIIGVLMFVKQLPKLLEGLGIKLDGDGKFTLNPLKKFGEEALGGKKILGFGAAGVAGAAAGATNFASRMFHPNSWKDDKNKFSFGKGLKSMLSAPGSAIAGAGSAMWRGGKKAMKEEKMGKIFGDSYGEAMFAKKQREDLNRKGSTVLGRALADINRITGNYTAAQNDSIRYGTMEADHKATMDKIKAAKEAATRDKYLKQDKFKRQRDNLQDISNQIESQKVVKDAKEKVDSLLNSGKYYAKTGELNSEGLKKKRELDSRLESLDSKKKTSSTEIDRRYENLNKQNVTKQQEIDNKQKAFANEENEIQNQSNIINNTISQMKANGTYYVTDAATGKIKKDSDGNEMLTDAAKIEETKLSNNNKLLEDAKRNHAEEIKKQQDELNAEKEKQEKDKQAEEEKLEQEIAKEEQAIKDEQAELVNNKDYVYEEGQLTEEGKSAKAALDSASAEAFKDLQENNVAVQESVKNLKDLGIDVSQYTKEDGSFNKKTMFDITDQINKIDREYQAQEAKYENDEREEIRRFNDEVAEAGLDPSSDRVLKNKADDASHKITTKEAPGTQMSARTVNRDTYTKYSNEFTYNGPNGPHGPHGPHGPGDGS